MNKPEWDDTFIKVAEEMAKHSTCVRLKVGAVVVKDRRIVGTGYNGTPKGHVHCEEIMVGDYGDFRSDVIREMHHSFSEKWEIHAEMNAIIDMAKREESPQGSTLYITTAPCSNCAKLIIASGIRRVVYLYNYDRGHSHIDETPGREIPENEIWFSELTGPQILRFAGVTVEQYQQTT